MMISQTQSKRAFLSAKLSSVSAAYARSMPGTVLSAVLAYTMLVAGCNSPASSAVSDAPVPKAGAVDTPSAPRTENSAPETFTVLLTTTAGDVEVEVTRAWAPLGADRFYELVNAKFFEGCKFFRIVPGFVAQFGINGDPEVAAKWRENRIKDDPVKESNKRGTLVFATSGPNSRTSQLFINFGDNKNLDAMGFSPFGKVTKGMDIVDKFYSAYGERPNQGLIQQQGNKYLESSFPKLDGIISATIIDK